MYLHDFIVILKIFNCLKSRKAKQKECEKCVPSPPQVLKTEV